MKKVTSSVGVAEGRNGNRPAGPSAEQLTQQNVETITRLEEAAREKRTPTDRLAQAPHLKALSEETQPERLIEQIEARENN